MSTFLLSALAIVVLLAPVAGASRASNGLNFPSIVQHTEQTFLGFRQGQELRYAFEIEGGRQQDSIVHWSITLQGVNERGSEGTFDLGYIAVIAGKKRAQATAQTRFNAYGFPLSVNFTSERNTVMGAVGYSIEYRFEGDSFRKELMDGDFDDQKLKLEDYAGVNTSFPRGLYLYTPLDSECIKAFAGLPLNEESAAGSGRGEFQVEEICHGREMIFANPGLLNLTMPALWETGTGTLDFFVLAPTGMRLDLLTGPPSGVPGGGVNIAGFSLNRMGRLIGLGPSPFNGAEDALQNFGLAASSDLLQLDIGGRIVDAWRLDPPAPFSAVYVDGNGSIVRLDLAEEPMSGFRGWIRRLRPSEL